jgi:preprotein translocase subunit SecA
MWTDLGSKALHLLITGGRPSAARLSRWSRIATEVEARCKSLQTLSVDQLRTEAAELRWRVKSGEPEANLRVPAFALAREASRRATGMSHFHVQIMGGLALFEGGVAEMQTGEGKTLTAVLPTFLRSLCGKGAHVVTTNDYLAQRDANEMGPAYELLGLTVGCVQTKDDDSARRQAYACDITYGTAKEFGFDFLRDRLKQGAAIGRRPTAGSGGDAPVQRGYYFALVDEADSVLIDEARTPLIIALTQPNDPAVVGLYRWCDRIVRANTLTAKRDYLYEPERRHAVLTDEGCRHVLLLNKPTLLDGLDVQRLYKQVEMALVAHLGFQRNKDYVIDDEKVVIVDESTGRKMEGRKWQDGLHQAVEAKEYIPITAATGQAARITVQTFFRHYTHLAGMTGTGTQVAGEFRRTYTLSTTVIPTNKPCIRRGLPYRVFRTLEEKCVAAAKLIRQLQLEGRAILVGTPSVERSRQLSEYLKGEEVQHTVLNAYFHKEEAEIVANAGLPGRVTIATNMAGRGTDIKLHPDVRASGGLHVIATELHSSLRIDRQLIGRAARQGDPGTYQFLLSFDDELLRCLPRDVVERRRKSAAADANGEVASNWLGFFRRAQRLLERMHRKERRDLLKAERHRIQQYEKMGLDPYLEMTVD